MRILHPVTPRNLTLKIAILESGRKHKAIARELRLSPSVLSKKIYGELPWRDDEERRAFARAVRRKVSELFPSSSVEAVAL